MAGGSERITFPNPSGARLAARLDRPAAEPRAFALFAHCFACGKDALASSRISRALAAEGIATLRIDFAGIEALKSKVAPEGFGADVADLVAAAGHMREKGCPPRLLVGHSLGGAAAIAAAGQIPEIAAVTTIAAPFDVEHVTRLFAGGIDELREKGEADVRIGGRPFTLRQSFVDDLASHDQGERIRALDRPLLILHSPEDTIVGIDNATEIFKAARHPKSFISLSGADHLTDLAEHPVLAGVVDPARVVADDGYYSWLSAHRGDALATLTVAGEPVGTAVAFEQQAPHGERDAVAVVGRDAPLPERLRDDAEHRSAVEVEAAGVDLVEGVGADLHETRRGRDEGTEEKLRRCALCLRLPGLSDSSALRLIGSPTRPSGSARWTAPCGGARGPRAPQG